jgi:glutamate-1-semialdehyde 2,1-aminomutase
MSHPNRDQISQDARKVIPGGMMSNFRKEEIFVPVYVSHGKGARLYDVEGNEFIDFSLSSGPAILGHDNPHVREALITTAQRLYTGEATELQVRAAQKIVQHLPGVEQVRFCCSGSEADQMALRVARAFTGRDKFVRFNGHYNGGADNIMGGIVVDPENPTPVASEREEDLFSVMCNTAGRARDAFGECFLIEWNDLPSLERLFQRFADDIAAVIMEPVMTNISGCVPEPGYLEGVRELCTLHDVLLIFDEVITGFRMGLSGAQGHYGVIPDLTVLAKAMGAGFPVSAFGGKREILDVLTSTDCVVGGTYNGHPMAMAAVIATIEELERDDGAAFRNIEKHGRMLKEGIDSLSARLGQNLLLQGYPAAWSFTFSDKKPLINHRDSLGAGGGGLAKAAEFGALLKKRRVLTSFRFCTSAAHREEDVLEALDRVDDALKEMSR